MGGCAAITFKTSQAGAPIIRRMNNIDTRTYVHGYAVTATWAWHHVFARLAYDQHANFNLPNQKRISVGLLF